MKWTTANVKNPNYTANHEIFVGTQTGSFKKLVPAYEDNPFVQTNLHDLSKLNKDSQITALEFGNEERSEILVGHAHNTVEIHSLRTQQVVSNVQVQASPVVGVARYAEQLIVGCNNGHVQQLTLAEVADAAIPDVLLNAGDDMAHLRQCPSQRTLVATGGKGRQNNLKVFDMAAGGKQIFASKNLPNDYLQLEVPVWDSDVGFIDTPYTLATCSRYGYVRVYDTRKQRRPVQCFATEDHMSFSTLAASGNYIYTGSTVGALKAFDIRRMKTFVHTYKGFTGAVSDLHIDASGKFLASSSLDRYVRVHHVDSCVLLYQCYVKSKATRVLIRESMETPDSNANNKVKAEEEQEDEEKVAKRKSKDAVSEDEEYEDIFDSMQIVCENEDGEAEEETSKTEPKNNKSSKRKNSTKTGNNKRGKH